MPQRLRGLPAWNIPELFGNEHFSRGILIRSSPEQCVNKALALFLPTEICALHMFFYFIQKTDGTRYDYEKIMTLCPNIKSAETKYIFLTCLKSYLKQTYFFFCLKMKDRKN